MVEQPKLPPAVQQQIPVLNARIQTVNLAQADLLREVDGILKTFASINSALETKIMELQAPVKEKAPK